MWRTARITFVFAGCEPTTEVLRVFFDPAYGQWWEDDAAVAALLAVGVDDFRIIDWACVD